MLQKRFCAWAGQEGPGGQRWGLGHQLRRGADLSLVTVGFSWTLAKGFLKKERRGVLVWEGHCEGAGPSWAALPPGGPPAPWMAPAWTPMAQPLSSEQVDNGGRSGEPGKGARWPPVRPICGRQPSRGGWGPWGRRATGWFLLCNLSPERGLHPGFVSRPTRPRRRLPSAQGQWWTHF